MARYEYKSSLLDLSQASSEILHVVDIWKSHKVDSNHPLKSALNPFDYREHLGKICVVEIENNPLDFVYRLDGTEISAASNEDLNGQSILAGTPIEIYENHFDEFKETLRASAPHLWQISYRVEEQYDYHRLILPYVKDDEAEAGTPGYFLTYCYSLTSPLGDFETFRHLSPAGRKRL